MKEYASVEEEVKHLRMVNGQLRGAIKNLRNDLKFERKQREELRKRYAPDGNKKYRNNSRKARR